MKIIDLLNKITNGEEVPVKIKYKGKILYYDDEDNETNNYNATFNYYDKDGENALFEGWIGQYLNDEVEILEEEKKIPEKTYTNRIINTEDILEFEMIQNKINAEYAHAINSIIDYLKSKGE